MSATLKSGDFNVDRITDFVAGTDTLDVATAATAPTLITTAFDTTAFDTTAIGTTGDRHDRRSRHQPRVPAVAIGKRVDGDQPVVQPDGDLVGWIGVVLHPVAHVIERLRGLDRDPVSLDPDIPRRRARIVSFLSIDALISNVTAITYQGRW